LIQLTRERLGEYNLVLDFSIFNFQKIFMTTKIGIDIDGVLANDKLVHIKTNNYSIFSIMDGAIESLKKISELYGAENIYIISCVPTNQLSFIVGIWLEFHQILQKTMIPLDNVIICAQYKDKSEIAEKLNLTHMIDNKLQVLNYFSKNFSLIAFNPEMGDFKKYPELASRIVIVNSWSEISNYFLDL